MTLKGKSLSYVSPTHIGLTCGGEMGLVHLKKIKLLYYVIYISLIYKFYTCEIHVLLDDRSHIFSKGDIFFSI